MEDIGILRQSVADITTPLRQRVIDLSVDHPDWLPILRAACVVAERIGDAAFAGSWVLQEYARSTPGATTNKPGLRRLVAYGLIESTGETSRGGKRAYYRMEHRREIAKLLDELGT